MLLGRERAHSILHILGGDLGDVKNTPVPDVEHRTRRVQVETRELLAAKDIGTLAGLRGNHSGQQSAKI
jgi:hypothetical protein